jgi:hypothetical protein
MQRSTVPSEGEDFRKLRAAHWVQAMGSANDNRRDIDLWASAVCINFEEAWSNSGLYPACMVPRYMTGVAKGVELLAYHVHSNPTAAKGSFVGAPDAVERQIIETIDALRMMPHSASIPMCWI